MPFYVYDRIRDLGGGQTTLLMKKKTFFLFLTVLLLESCAGKINQIEVSSITLSDQELTIETGSSKVLTVEYQPSNATSRDITWVSSDPRIATVEDGIITGLTPGITVIVAKCGTAVDKCEVTVVVAKEAIDLGLSVKWASFNVGGTTPEAFGDLYKWGEIEPYNGAGHYKWTDDGYDHGKILKYCVDEQYGVVDGKTVLDLEDDVAHVKWGGSWRMPTHEEYNELVDKCTWRWTTRNNMNGYEITGTTGNTIFLPANAQNSSGEYIRGEYWTSTLQDGARHAYYGIFISTIPYKAAGYWRTAGYAIRPVTK